MDIIIGIISIVAIVLFLRWLFTPKKKPAKKPPSLADYNPAPQAEKDQLFIEWCRRKGISRNRRRTENQLFDYVTDFKLPTIEDWKELHGYQRSQWVDRKIYTDWLKFVGAYNPKFDPDHPEWDGR